MSQQNDRRRFGRETLATGLSTGWATGVLSTVVPCALAAAFFVVDLPTAEASPQDGRRRPRRRANPAPVPPPPAAAPTTGRFRGPTRIDFDDRLIQGQTNKSGAVYLFDRKETGISSMVRRRKSFRHLTIATIYDR